MNEIKTAEQFLLAEYERLQQENSGLRARMKGLADELDALKGQPDSVDQDENPVERHVSMWKLDEPIELAYLDVKSYYDMRNSDNPLKLTADEIREHLAPGTLREIAGMRRGGSYSASPLVYVDIHISPYTLRLGRYRFGLDASVWNGKSPNVSVYECLEDSDLSENKYFPAEREQELFEYGLKLLEKRLEKHLEWLEKEGKSGKWWEAQE